MYAMDRDKNRDRGAVFEDLARGFSVNSVRKW